MHHTARSVLSLHKMSESSQYQSQILRRWICRTSMLYPDPNPPKNPYATIPETYKFVLLPAIAVPLECGSDILSDPSARDGVAG
jgi:hypothetical protein